MTDDPDLDRAYALRTPDDNRRLYATWAGTYDADFVERHGFRLPALVAGAYVANGGGWPCLDVGCGTGAVAAHLPEGAVIDGLDLSPEMLAVARTKGLYRDLVQADLSGPLDIAGGSYAGLVSAGTFTHGHVGGGALVELTRLLRPGALATISIKPEIYETHRFREVLERLSGDGLVSVPVLREERIYAEGRAPEGHDADTAILATFRRL